MCIFAYGQTGSGKTHTMSGTDVERLEGRGINYRALDDLFALNHERRAEVGRLLGWVQAVRPASGRADEGPEPHVTAGLADMPC